MCGCWIDWSVLCVLLDRSISLPIPKLLLVRWINWSLMYHVCVLDRLLTVIGTAAGNDFF
jgi:hypothetical protein